MTATLDNVDHEHHDESIFMSHILWKVRREIGKESISKMLRSFIDNLNSYYDSFQFFLKEQEIRNRRDKLKFEIEYFSAILIKTAMDYNKEEGVTRAVSRVIDELGLDSEKVEYLSKNLIKNQKGFRMTEEERRVRNAVGLVIPYLALAAEGAALIVLYNILSD